MLTRMTPTRLTIRPTVVWRGGNNLGHADATADSLAQDNSLRDSACTLQRYPLQTRTASPPPAARAPRARAVPAPGGFHFMSARGGGRAGEHAEGCSRAQRLCAARARETTPLRRRGGASRNASVRMPDVRAATVRAARSAQRAWLPPGHRRRVEASRPGPSERSILHNFLQSFAPLRGAICAVLFGPCCAGVMRMPRARLLLGVYSYYVARFWASIYAMTLVWKGSGEARVGRRACTIVTWSRSSRSARTSQSGQCRTDLGGNFRSSSFDRADDATKYKWNGCGTTPLRCVMVFSI